MSKSLFPTRAARVERNRNGDGPRASRPSDLEAPSLLSWCRAYPAEVRGPLIRMAIAIPFAIYFQPLLLLLVPWYLVRLHTILGHVWELGQVGCVNAAQVVALDPVRIACYEDLRLGLQNEAPSLTVVTLPKGTIGGEPASLGQKLTCVCAYSGQDDDARWTAMSPVPTASLTDSDADLDRHRGLVTAADWQRLEAALQIVGPEPITGTHRLGWRSVTAMDLGQFQDFEAPALVGSNGGAA